MEIDFILKIAAIGIIVSVLNQILSRSGREEYATLTVLAGILVIILMLIPELNTMLEMVRSVFAL